MSDKLQPNRRRQTGASQAEGVTAPVTRIQKVIPDQILKEEGIVFLVKEEK